MREAAYQVASRHCVINGRQRLFITQRNVRLLLGVLRFRPFITGLHALAVKWISVGRTAAARPKYFHRSRLVFNISVSSCIALKKTEAPSWGGETGEPRFGRTGVISQQSFWLFSTDPPGHHRGNKTKPKCLGRFSIREYHPTKPKL